MSSPPSGQLAPPSLRPGLLPWPPSWNYHDQRFTMRLTSEEKGALAAFLSAL